MNNNAARSDMYWMDSTVNGNMPRALLHIPVTTTHNKLITSIDRAEAHTSLCNMYTLHLIFKDQHGNNIK